jgi:hypothetical protein
MNVKKEGLAQWFSKRSTSVFDGKYAFISVFSNVSNISFVPNSSMDVNKRSTGCLVRTINARSRRVEHLVSL